MSDIVGFKSFNTEEEFIAWQKETPRKVCQVSPLIYSLNASAFGENGSNVEATTCSGCFVVYVVEE